jgi:hypothetical protein
VPQTVVIPRGQTVFLAYEAAAGASHVTLSLTPLAGRAVGYVSTTIAKPSAAGAD